MSNKACHDLIERFQMSFFAMCRLNTFPWKILETELQTSPTEVILEILKKTSCHPVCRKTPPSVKYRRLFLSELIKRHESTVAEPLDELYDLLAEVMSAVEEAVCYKTYILPSGKMLSLEENVAMISAGTTGLVTWEAALYLTEWALENSDLFFKRTVLELGSGAGLTGIAVCHACKPEKYIFSDCHHTVLQRLHNNIQHNALNYGTDVTVSVKELNWETVKEEDLEKIEADVIIAADVVYDPKIIGPLVRLLAKLLHGFQKRNVEMYICSTVRNPETYSFFKNELDTAGLKHTAIEKSIPQVFPYDRISTIEIIKLHC